MVYRTASWIINHLIYAVPGDAEAAFHNTPPKCLHQYYVVKKIDICISDKFLINFIAPISGVCKAAGATVKPSINLTTTLHRTGTVSAA